MIGPIEIEATVHLRIAGGNAKVTVGLGVGEPVTEHDLLAAVGKAITRVREQFDDVELLDAETFFNEVLVVEKTGQRGNFALPASFGYDAAKTAEDALDALEQESAA